MSSYTVSDIESALKASYDERDECDADAQDDFSREDRSWETLGYEDDGFKFTLTIQCIPVECVKVGGKAPCEGGGEDVNIIFKVGDQYFEKIGYYMSHYGTDWDGPLREVIPVQRMTTFYDPK